MRSYIFFLAISITVLLEVDAQSTLTSRTRFYGENHHGNDLCGILNRRNYNTDVDAQAIVNKVVNAIGLKPNFVLVPCSNIGTCAATVFVKDNLLVDGYRYIIYDSSFMKEIETSSGTDWSSTAIVAHEIAHHLLGHTLNTTNDEANRKEELEADEWSGYASRLLGATLQQAQLALNNMSHPSCADEGFYDHPCKSKRLVAVAEGWTRADNFLENRTPTRNSVSNINVEDVSLKTEFNVSDKDRNGDTKLGMKIHVKFDIANALGRECRANAYFYYRGGKNLKANTNYGYFDTDNNVATGKDFKPSYENSIFSDLEIFMPYDGLNLSKNGKFNLKYDVVFFVKDTNGNNIQKLVTAYNEFFIEFKESTQTNTRETIVEY